jgi:hypothetical protein
VTRDHGPVRKMPGAADNCGTQRGGDLARKRSVRGWPLNCGMLPLNIKGALRVSFGNGLRPPLTLSLRKHSGQKTKGQAASLARVRGHPLHGYGSCRSLSGQLVGVGVPALVGLPRVVLVAASPERPALAVGLVAARLGDDGAAEGPKQFGDGDGDQLEDSGVLVASALEGCGDGEEEIGEQADRGPAVPGGPGGDLAAVEAADLLRLLVVLFDGLIANGKFCCVRRVQLSLTWWHRPLRLRGSALHTDVALVGEPDDPDLDRLPPVQPAPGRRAPVGSGLPVAGASGRAGRPARPDADR